MTFLPTFQLHSMDITRRDAQLTRTCNPRGSESAESRRYLADDRKNFKRRNRGRATWWNAKRTMAIAANQFQKADALRAEPIFAMRRSVIKRGVLIPLRGSIVATENFYSSF
ncbi:hypothetical protein QLX08_008824 [Tetragonisca angustula]|uniref:Uncharacterized protein n=1 Tax=Tetragonisca angustula TaxID=166442 RepID=A0AAW0ZIP8_9HYME